MHDQYSYAMTFLFLGSGGTDKDECPSCEPFGLTCNDDLFEIGSPSTTPNTGYPDWLDAGDVSRAQCFRCLLSICPGNKLHQADH